MQVNLRIGDRQVAAQSGATFERRNPVSGELVSQAAAAGAADVNAAIAAAEAAFESWSQTGPNVRRDAMFAVADVLRRRADDLVDWMVKETGTSVAWAKFNVQGSLNLLKESASLATQVAGEVIPSDKPGCLALTERVPAGVVVSMAPWNAPLLLGLRGIAMPLVCGNTVVFKASELCPASHAGLVELFVEAGLPAGTVNFITHDRPQAAEVVEALIAHPAVRRVNFTGSTRVGSIVGRLAGQYLKPALLELGGKAPLVVLADADLDQAVDAAVFGAYMNQGQICMSTERIVVDATVADTFVAKLVARTRDLKARAPNEGGVLAGLIDAGAAAQVKALIDDAVEKGATLCTPWQHQGTLVDPMVVDHVTPAMRLYSDESFGPIASVVRVPDEATAVRVANDTEYGLAGAVFGRDLARTLRVARRLQVGICHVNGATVASEPQLPFGGVKSSGFGRFGGRAVIDEFTELRVLNINTQPSRYPL